MEMPFSPSELKKAAQALSERYRKGTTPFLQTEQDRYAYLLTRFPATQAVLKRVFQEIRSFPIQTMLDIGAGPGTSWGAARETWDSFERATLVERDKEFIQIGSQMIASPKVQWVAGDVSSMSSFEPHDLVVFSYSWGEVRDLQVLQKAWQAAQRFLIVIEPGTPRGYQSVLQARTACIAEGGHVVAPCPHSLQCPLEHTKNWCHFGVRLQRSAEHQWVKEGSLGYEDEKYSYLIITKMAVSSSFARLLSDPLKRKGHTIMTLCTKQGIGQTTYTKKNKPEYKRVNKLHWGDFISLE